jgi:CubicO group peptidase (beta-lactamase class C family)
MAEFDLAAADEVLHAGVTGRLWPGLVAAVGAADDVRRQWVLGAAENWAGGYRPMRADTVFDLASLTKVLATLPCVLLLVQHGELALDDPVARYLPAVDERIRIRHLLSHTSGLPAHRRFDDRVRSAAELERAAAAVRPARTPGTAVEYSDLGFILLGAVLHTVAGRPLADLAGRVVFAPLGSAATFAPPAAWLPRIAATEVVDGRAVIGRVHDENAAAAQGRTGHAGLFGTLDDVLREVPIWLPGGPLLRDDIRADALRDHTAGLGGHRGLGWTCRGDRHDILSDGWGPAAVSHTGFTGTSVALDPETGRWAVLLTNHVHFGRGRPEVFAARRRFHACLVGDRPAD